MFRELTKAIRITLVLWLITGLIYPALILVVGQVTFPNQANGSLIQNEQGQIIGSALIGQSFTSANYFWSRPSAINYSSFTQTEQDSNNIGQKTGISGASNLAPSNPALLERIAPAVERLKQAQIQPTADLIYTSGSGLDPHITVEAARNQMARVARARGLNPSQIEWLIVRQTEGRTLGIFGEPRVNVLKLNLALDRI